MFLMSLLPYIQEMSDSQMKQCKRRVLILIDDILGDAPTQYETSSSVSSHAATPMLSTVSPELLQMHNFTTSSEQGAMSQWLKTAWNM
jgi:hypothetical protein